MWPFLQVVVVHLMILNTFHIFVPIVHVQRFLNLVFLFFVSLYYVGLYIKRKLFSYGQLYVALSRCKSPKNIYIQNNLENSLEIENIVWEEILDD